MPSALFLFCLLRNMHSRRDLYDYRLYWLCGISNSEHQLTAYQGGWDQHGVDDNFDELSRRVISY